jgi:hypothetical protein
MYSIKPFEKLMLSKFPTVDPNPDDYKKMHYDSQATHWEQGVSSTPIGCLGVIHDSQPAKLHKKPPQKVEALTFCLKNCLKLNFLIKTFNKI